MANLNATNNSKRATRIYKDLDLDFGRNVVTNDVNKLTDVESVKRSVRNLINTNHFERPFHPEIGGNVRALLFENMTPLTALNLQRKIEEVLSNFEPRATFVDSNNNVRPSTRYVEDGSYFKIKNVQLGYNFNVSNSKTLDAVRLYLQGKNLMTFTDYTGYDPEMSGGVLDTGIDRGNYPSPRTVSVGLNVKF